MAEIRTPKLEVSSSVQQLARDRQELLTSLREGMREIVLDEPIDTWNQHGKGEPIGKGTSIVVGTGSWLLRHPESGKETWFVKLEDTKGVFLGTVEAADLLEVLPKPDTVEISEHEELKILQPSFEDESQKPRSLDVQADEELEIPLSIEQVELDSIGHKIWENECDGTKEGLTSWNKQEKFGSFGIGHFIWFYEGGDRNYDESFPPLMTYLKSQNVSVPDWMFGDCPWKSQEQLNGTDQSISTSKKRDLAQKKTELQNLLFNTTGHQSEFIRLRAERALPSILESLSEYPSISAQIRNNMELLVQSPKGRYALLDYVNFKGEGNNPEKDRIALSSGEKIGWGLYQVFLHMEASTTAAQAAQNFANAAHLILVKRRIDNQSSVEWARKGWTSRTKSYSPEESVTESNPSYWRDTKEGIDRYESELPPLEVSQTVPPRVNPSPPRISRSRVIEAPQETPEREVTVESLFGSGFEFLGPERQESLLDEYKDTTMKVNGENVRRYFEQEDIDLQRKHGIVQHIIVTESQLAQLIKIPDLLEKLQAIYGNRHFLGVKVGGKHKPYMADYFYRDEVKGRCFHMTRGFDQAGLVNGYPKGSGGYRHIGDVLFTNGLECRSSLDKFYSSLAAPWSERGLVPDNTEFGYSGIEIVRYIETNSKGKETGRDWDSLNGKRLRFGAGVSSLTVYQPPTPQQILGFESAIRYANARMLLHQGKDPNSGERVLPITDSFNAIPNPSSKGMHSDFGIFAREVTDFVRTPAMEGGAYTPEFIEKYKSLTRTSGDPSQSQLKALHERQQEILERRNHWILAIQRVFPTDDFLVDNLIPPGTEYAERRSKKEPVREEWLGYGNERIKRWERTRDNLTPMQQAIVDMCNKQYVEVTDLNTIMFSDLPSGIMLSELIEEDLECMCLYSPSRRAFYVFGGGSYSVIDVPGLHVEEGTWRPDESTGFVVGDGPKGNYQDRAGNSLVVMEGDMVFPIEEGVRSIPQDLKLFQQYLKDMAGSQKTQAPEIASEELAAQIFDTRYGFMTTEGVVTFDKLEDETELGAIFQEDLSQGICLYSPKTKSLIVFGSTIPVQSVADIQLSRGAWKPDPSGHNYKDGPRGNYVDVNGQLAMIGRGDMVFPTYEHFLKHINGPVILPSKRTPEPSAPTGTPGLFDFEKLEKGEIYRLPEEMRIAPKGTPDLTEVEISPVAQEIVDQFPQEFRWGARRMMKKLTSMEIPISPQMPFMVTNIGTDELAFYNPETGEVEPPISAGWARKNGFGNRKEKGSKGGQMLGTFQIGAVKYGGTNKSAAFGKTSSTLLGTNMERIGLDQIQGATRNFGHDTDKITASHNLERAMGNSNSYSRPVNGIDDGRGTSIHGAADWRPKSGNSLGCVLLKQKEIKHMAEVVLRARARGYNAFEESMYLA